MDSVSADEWRDQFIGERVAGLTWWEGAAAALFDLGGKADVDAILNHPFMKAIAAVKTGNKSVRNTVWGALQYHTIEDSKTVKMSKRIAPAVFEKNSDSSWTFAGEWNEVSDDLKKLVADYRSGPRRVKASSVSASSPSTSPTATKSSSRVAAGARRRC